MTTLRDYKKGLVKTGAAAAVVAAALANAVNLYLLSAGRTCRIRKLHIYNGQGAPVQVMICVGLAPGVQVFPNITAVNGVDLELTEDDLPDFEFVVNPTVAASAAGAGALAVTVMATVEEYQGPTG